MSDAVLRTVNPCPAPEYFSPVRKAHNEPTPDSRSRILYTAALDVGNASLMAVHAYSKVHACLESFCCAQFLRTRDNGRAARPRHVDRCIHTVRMRFSAQFLRHRAYPTQIPPTTQRSSPKNRGFKLWGANQVTYAGRIAESVTHLSPPSLSSDACSRSRCRPPWPRARWPRGRARRTWLGVGLG